MIWRTLTPTAWLILALLLCVLLTLTVCRANERERQQRAEADAARTMSDARTQAARDAMMIQHGTALRDLAASELTKENRDAIFSAPGAGQRLDPGLDAAARRAICLRQSAAHLPECRAVLDADPR